MTKPQQLDDVIGGTAVRPEWNNGTKYVEFIVPDEGIKAWTGSSARQKVLDCTDSWVLPGGTTQIYIPDPYRKWSDIFDNLKPIEILLP